MNPRCPTCGERIPPSAGECLYCPPPGEAAAPTPSRPVSATTTPAPPAAAAADSERAFGLLLFEAEEELARGNSEKAVVLASRAVHQRPSNLTARGVYGRARRELLRGRRREKLEARIQEAQAKLEEGDLRLAERILTSALKLVPDHVIALGLFAQLKEHRLAADTLEAEAERELERLAREQARRALIAARTAHAAGWERRALLAVRRGLRLVPDEPALLGLLRELQGANRGQDAETARRRALAAQTRTGRDLLAKGELAESLKVLRAVLREDPDDAHAQSAIQELRRAWLERDSRTASAAATAAAAPARPAPAAPRTGAAPAPPPAPTPQPRVASSRPPLRASTPPPAPVPRAVVPAEIMLPRTLRRRTPFAWVLLAAAAVVGAIVFVAIRRTATTAISDASPPPALPAAGPVTPAAGAIERPGPLTDLEPELRQAIEGVLADYARALEARDADRLALARPDLSREERGRLLARFAGALNVATDLRVLEVTGVADGAEVSVLRTDVIVGGRAGSGAPVEETLRFVRRRGAWSLRGGS